MPSDFHFANFRVPPKGDAHQYLPVGDLPVIGPSNVDEYWVGMDNEVAYKAAGGHPLYGPTDIVYRANSHGYRAPSFDTKADIKIVSIGCSIPFGIGLPQDSLYAEIFAEHLRAVSGKTVVHWNLANAGASPDYVARTLHLSIPILQPDLVLVLFPQIGRREYLGPDMVRWGYTPGTTPWAKEAEKVLLPYGSLTSLADDQIRFFRNYKSVEGLLFDRDWVFGFTQLTSYETELSFLKPHMDGSRWADQWRGMTVDVARDHCHPGPKTHRLIEESFWNRFIACGAYERIMDAHSPSGSPAN